MLQFKLIQFRKITIVISPFGFKTSKYRLLIMKVFYIDLEQACVTRYDSNLMHLETFSENQKDFEFTKKNVLYGNF